MKKNLFALLLLMIVSPFATYASDSLVVDRMLQNEENEPVKYVKANLLDSNQAVEVVWGMQYYGGGEENFETGDFSANDWNNEISNYPWAITDVAYEGDYAMKSTCEGIDYGVSAIEIAVSIPDEGFVGFYYKISSEQNFDFGNFYIDGVKKFTVSGAKNWSYREVEITEGEHILKWEYVKDESTNNGDDAFYIDNITFFKEIEPFAGGWLTYDDDSFKGCVGLGEQAPLYWAVLHPANPIYAGYQITKMSVYDSQDAFLKNNSKATATANVYLGGDTAPATLVATKEFIMSGTDEFVEIVFDTPVLLDGTQNVWLSVYTDKIHFPAAGSFYNGNPNSDWISLNGNLWEHAASDYNLTYTWMIRGFLESSKGETVMMNDELSFEGGVSTGTLVAAENVTPKYVGSLSNDNKSSENRALSSYKLYRKSIYGEQELLMENTLDTSYVDNAWATIESDVYQWGVSVVYEDETDSTTDESPIVWSKSIDKDMTTSVTVSVSTDSNDPVTGTTVTLKNTTEAGFVYTTTLGNENSVTWNGFRKGSYEFTVVKDGFVSDIENEIVEIWDASQFNVVLEEQLTAVSDLYVSPTGWAMWTNTSEDSKALLKYKVFLNGDIESENCTDSNYQHENLVDGTEYTTKVIASYTMGDSEAVEYTWTKVSADDFAGLEELVATFDDDVVELTWTLPETNAEILGVMVYRNDELITEDPVSGVSMIDENGEIDDEYCVKVVYGGQEDVTYYAMSDSECAVAEFTISCDAPERLYGEYTKNDDGSFGTMLRLSYNPDASEWLYYDDGVNEDALGGPESFYWGVMFPAEMMKEYDGMALTKVSMYIFTGTSGDINIYYGGDNAPGELVHSQPYSSSVASAFQEFELTASLPIDPSMNLWVIFSTSQGTTYPAALSADCGNPNSRWISLDGQQWQDFVGIAGGVTGTWMVRALLKSAKGETAELATITDYEYKTSTGNIAKAGYAKGDDFDHYNIYRSTTNGNYELVGESATKIYYDQLTEPGIYYYQVTAVYAAYGEECESEPATAYEDENQDYIVVDATAIDESGVKGMMIYPNPTQGNLTINAEAIIRITITNALGQVIYDQEIAADNAIVNMSQYGAGVYMVRIATATGITVERVTVVK